MVNVVADYFYGWTMTWKNMRMKCCLDTDPKQDTWFQLINWISFSYLYSWTAQRASCSEVGWINVNAGWKRSKSNNVSSLKVHRQFDANPEINLQRGAVAISFRHALPGVYAKTLFNRRLSFATGSKPYAPEGWSPRWGIIGIFLSTPTSDKNSISPLAPTSQISLW